jgi:hypothetical protein
VIVAACDNQYAHRRRVGCGRGGLRQGIRREQKGQCAR